MSNFKVPKPGTRAFKHFEKEINVYRWKEGLGSHKVSINSDFSRSEQQLWLKLQSRGFRINKNGNLYNPNRKELVADRPRVSSNKSSKSSSAETTETPINNTAQNTNVGEVCKLPDKQGNNLLTGTNSTPQKDSFLTTFFKLLKP